MQWFLRLVTIVASALAFASPALASGKPHKSKAKMELRKGLDPVPLSCTYYSEGFLDEYGLPQTYEWTVCYYTRRGLTRSA